MFAPSNNIFWLYFINGTCGTTGSFTAVSNPDEDIPTCLRETVSKPEKLLSPEVPECVKKTFKEVHPLGVENSYSSNTQELDDIALVTDVPLAI